MIFICLEDGFADAQLLLQEKHQRRSNSSTPAGSYERPNTFSKHVNGFDKRKARAGGSSNGWDKAAPPSRPSHGATPQDGHAVQHGPATVAEARGPHRSAAIADNSSADGKGAAPSEAAPVTEAALVNGVA
jgi:hypothetical protein